MKFDVMKFIQIVAQVGPVILAAIPHGEKLAPVIPKIVEGIREAEQIKGASGPEKKQHVMNVVNTAIAIANTTGKVKIDAAAAAQAASTGIDTVISTVKIIEAAKPDKSASADVAPQGSEAAATELAATAGAPPAPPKPGNPGTTATPGDLGGGHATHGHGSSDT